MKKFDGVLLCSDLDGTLTNSKGILTLKVIDSINYFQNNGGFFTIATGRLPDYISHFAEQLSIKVPVICHNGATIYSYEEKRFLYSNLLHTQTAKLFRFIFENFDCVNSVHLYSFDAGYEFFTSKSIEMFEVIHNTPLCKALLTINSAENAIYLKNCLENSIFRKHYNFERSWPVGLEILDKGSSKGEAVKKLRNIIPNLNKVICVGDYENDITMLECADIGYAVGNACTDVLDVADRVTVSNNDDAIYNIIYDL